MKKLNEILIELDNLENYIFENVNENDVEDLSLKICDLKNLVEDVKDEMYDIKDFMNKLL